MTEGEMPCTCCGVLLLRHKWNSVTDMTSCDNPMCEMFHRPVHIDKQERKAEIKVTKWLGGQDDSKSSEITRRLQRLQHLFYTKDS